MLLLSLYCCENNACHVICVWTVVNVCLSFSVDKWWEGESVESGRLGWKWTSSKNWSSRRTSQGGKQHQQVCTSSCAQIHNYFTHTNLWLGPNPKLLYNIFTQVVWPNFAIFLFNQSVVILETYSCWWHIPCFRYDLCGFGVTLQYLLTYPVQLQQLYFHLKRSIIQCEFAWKSLETCLIWSVLTQRDAHTPKQQGQCYQLFSRYMK